jgi:phosphomannomutase
MNRAIFKAYDIRGTYPEEINPETVTTIAGALAELTAAGVFVIAHDTRHGSPELATTLHQAMTAAAAKLGKTFQFELVGLSTTPMFYFLVNHFGASGGAMITASHNPANYNGLKVVGPGATTISGTDILKFYERKLS